MKLKHLTASILAMAALLLASPAFAQEHQLTFEKNEKSQLKFDSTAPAEKIVGVIKDVSGEVKLNLEDLSKTTGKLSFPVKAMNTGNDLRDRHMAGDEWLNAAKNPNITFTVNGIQDAKTSGDADKVIITGLAVGTVNVNGVDAPSKAKVTITLLKSKGIVKVEPAFDVKLADHKIAGKKGVVGSKVGELVTVSGALYGKVK